MFGFHNTRAHRQTVRRKRHPRLRLPLRVEELEARALLATSALSVLSPVASQPASLESLTAVLGQSATPGQFAALPTNAAPFPGTTQAVAQGDAALVRTDTISFSQLAIPGSQASPMAELPPVPFPSITGPVMPAPGPANTVPTFAVDVARVNNGVGEGIREQPARSSTGKQPTQLPVQPPTLLAPSILLEPIKGEHDTGTEQLPESLAPSFPLPEANTTWEAASAAYFATAAEPAPARPELPALPLSLDETAAAPQTAAVVGMVGVLGGAFWWHPERTDLETQARRRRSLSAWSTPI
jgi:hypothetical protein